MKNENLWFFTFSFHTTEEHALGVCHELYTSGFAILITINHTCLLRRMTRLFIRISFIPLFLPTMHRCLVR